MNQILSNYTNVFKNCTNFAGRADRKEYWMFVAVNILASLVLGIVDGITGIPVLGLLYMLVALLPSIAVTIRRLHDTDRSGWWMLVALIPFVGALLLLVLMILDGTNGENRFGSGSDPSSNGLATA